MMTPTNRSAKPGPKACPYCGKPAVIRDNAFLYGKSYGDVLVCTGYPECDAYVGVHKGTELPLGTLADPELRRWRTLAHTSVDAMWAAKPGEKQQMTRSEAYVLVRKITGLAAADAHVGEFTVEQCKELIKRLAYWSQHNTMQGYTGYELILKPTDDTDYEREKRRLNRRRDRKKPDARGADYDDISEEWPDGKPTFSRH